MDFRVIRWAVAVATAIGILGLGSTAAAASGCGDSWKNAAGGAWATGSNWSTGAPPTSSQNACITIGLSAPVVLNASTSVGGLRLGGTAGADELQLESSQTLTLGGNSTILDSGVLDQSSGALTIDQTGTLTNHGQILANDAQFTGNLTNAGDGVILDGGTLDFNGPGTLTNNGELSVPAGDNFTAPANGGASATVINGGIIQNGTAPSDGSFTLGAGSTLKQTTGRTTGSAPIISGGTLDLAGPGRSRYELTQNAILEGTVASAQTVLLDGDASTVGSITSNGTIAGTGTLTVPSGDTLTNDGSLVLANGDTFYMAGDLLNAASGRLAIGNGTSSSQFDVYGPVTLTNEGTITVSANAQVIFNASSDSGPYGTIDNAGGTIQNAGEILAQTGQTFDEGAGTATGAPIQVNGGTLNLEGSGASQFLELGSDGGSLSGNVAADQVLSGPLYPTGSFTNDGTLIPTAIHLPTGDTLTNNGTIDINRGGVQLFGSLDNAAGGVLGEQGSISLEAANTSITNAGTIYLLYSGGQISLDGCDCGSDENEFSNTGTFYVGVDPNNQEWGGSGASSSIFEAASETVELGGTIVPVLAGEPPAPPTPPATETYALTGSPGSPPQWTLTCGASVAGNWSLNCSSYAQLVEPSNTSLIPTEVSVASTGSTSYGQQATLTATVSAQSGAAPTGNVTFFSYIQPSAGSNWEQVPGDVLGTAPLTTSGGVTTATLNLDGLPPANRYDVEALYPGSSTDLASNSGFTADQTVSQATTATTFKATPASPAFGQPVTLTATVTPSTVGPDDPTGSVMFMDGNALLGQAPVVTSNGKTTATLSTTALLAGGNSVVANYAGDYNYADSQSASRTITGGAPSAPTTVTVSGPSSVAAGSTYTATATTNGTGGILYSLASSPAPPTGMTINSTTGAVTYSVPASGVTQFSYAVVASNTAGRAQSQTVTVNVT